MNSINRLFDPRGVNSRMDLCPCGEPRQINSDRCLDCLLDEQERAAPEEEEETP